MTASLGCLLGDGLRSEGLGIPSPLLGCHQVRGAHRAPVMDVPVIIQLKFLQSYENVEVPQIPFLDRVLQLPVVLQRHVRAVQTLQKLEIPPCSSSTNVLRAHCCALTGAGDGPDSAENRGVSACVLGQGCLAPCCKTGGCPDSAENREVSARVLGLGSMPVVVQRQVPDGRDSAENCGVSAVGAAPGQGC